MLKNVFTVLTRNTINLPGTTIALSAVVMMVAFVVLELFSFEGGAYLGTLTCLVLPRGETDVPV